MAKKEDGVWRTIGGRHIFIKDGQSVSEAMKASGKYPSAKKNKKEKTGYATIVDDEKLKKEADNLYDKKRDLFDKYATNKMSKEEYDAELENAHKNYKEKTKDTTIIKDENKYSVDGKETSESEMKAEWSKEHKKGNVEEDYETWKKNVVDDRNSNVKSAKQEYDTQNRYLERNEMMRVIDQWSSEGFEEGKYKSDYGKGVFHERYASGRLEGYGGEEDDFRIRDFDLGSVDEKEALKELNNKLSKYGYEAKYEKENTVHQDIRISKKQEKETDKIVKNGIEYNVVEHKEAGSFEGIGANRRKFYEATPEMYRIENPNDKSDWGWIEKKEYDNLKSSKKNSWQEEQDDKWGKDLSYKDEKGQYHINDTERNKIDKRYKDMKYSELEETYNSLERTNGKIDDSSYEARAIIAEYNKRKDFAKQFHNTTESLRREMNAEIDDDENTFRMSNGSKTVTISKGEDGKWVDSDGNKYMGYLSKSDVKSYFKGDYKEIKNNDERQQVRNKINEVADKTEKKGYNAMLEYTDDGDGYTALQNKVFNQAYREYMKEHPNSKLTFEKFKKYMEE